MYLCFVQDIWFTLCHSMLMATLKSDVFFSLHFLSKEIVVQKGWANWFLLHGYFNPRFVRAKHSLGPNNYEILLCPWSYYLPLCPTLRNPTVEGVVGSPLPGWLLSLPTLSILSLLVCLCYFDGNKGQGSNINVRLPQFPATLAKLLKLLTKDWTSSSPDPEICYHAAMTII